MQTSEDFSFFLKPVKSAEILEKWLRKASYNHQTFTAIPRKLLRH